VRNILDFPSQFNPRHHSHVDREHRSTHDILAAANGRHRTASERFTKNLWTERTPPPGAM